MKFLSTLVGSVIFLACGSTQTGQLTNFPGGESIAISINTPNGSGETIDDKVLIINTATFQMDNTGDGLTQLVYDGSRLIQSEYRASAFLGTRQLTYRYFSPTSLTFQTLSTSTYSASAYEVIQIFSGISAGQTALFWTDSINQSATVGSLSLRDDSSGSIISTMPVDLTNYGCGEYMGGGPITFCSGNYYGACTTSNSNLRLYSFNSSGVMQSGVTTTMPNSSYVNLNALTCYNNSLILTTRACPASPGSSCFYKFDTSLSVTATDSISSQYFPDELANVTSMSTDGTSLFLRGTINTKASSQTYTIGKATLGGLK